MRLIAIAASNRQPAWVEQGFDAYAKRLRGGWRLELVQIGLARRGATVAPGRAVAKEGERMLAAVPPGAHLVALTERGSPWSTADLVGKLRRWNAGGGPACFLIGGPDGLSPPCLQRAHEQWCLSPLTLPHGLARILLAEAVYRAWSVLQHHPYHRD